MSASGILWLIKSWFDINPPCKCGEVSQPNPENERGDKTCEFFVPSVDMYGKWNGGWGMCSNEKRFEHTKRNFSIYNHIVSWTINLNGDGCECIDCNCYKYQNRIKRKFKSARSILRATGIWL